VHTRNGKGGERENGEGVEQQSKRCIDQLQARLALFNHDNRRGGAW
jgi:hypothetical protein